MLDVRLPFPAPAETQQQALSALTMLAQSMWEEEKQYVPRARARGEGGEGGVSEREGEERGRDDSADSVSVRFWAMTMFTSLA